MRKLRRVTEAEVIAEFLKNEFYQGEFHRDRDQFEELVWQADLTDEDSNALRRALLFRRRGHMWREIPAATTWWEVQIELSDLDVIRVFPRAQWRRVADGSFLLRDIAERVRDRRVSVKSKAFVAKVQALSYRVRNSPDDSAVLLIGVEERQPMTILEGNHRLTAALLASPEILQERFRVFCGLSPKMAECCWYQTNMPNLWRYGRNRLRNLFYDRDADVERVLRPAGLEVAPLAPVPVTNAASEPK